MFRKAQNSEEEAGMADKEKAGRDGVKVSPDCGKRKEGSAGGRPEDALGSLKESLGIMKKAGERLGSLRKGGVPEQRG
jgi:hypothetical protein